MLRYLKKINLPENPEILLMLVLGICLQMTDGSPFSMKYRWRLVWDIELPAEYFSLIAQKIIKTILAIIIMVRCSTTYAYVVSAMLVIFCLLKKTFPKLMLLWLLVAGVKSICMTFVEAIAGVYVCSAFGKIRRPCIEFFISKALEIIFAAYLWGSVLSIYQDMENKAKSEKVTGKEEVFSTFIRQRARSLIDESTLYKTACLNNFEFKDVPQIILQMLRRDDEMSEDSLLGPGMMLGSVSNLGSFDNLKTSQSLGELGFTDLGSTQIVGLEEDENLSYQDKVLRFLKLTGSDVAKIKLNKNTVENDIFTVEDDIWARVIASGTHINKPKQTRTEVFIREIPHPEETVTRNENKRKKTLKFNVSFSNLLAGRQAECQDDQDEDDSSTYNPDEEEGKEDEETIRLFMSNIREGILIRRFGLGFGIKVLKENRYEKLYKQDFMSIIGPEVFERATNLPKVTSFTKLTRNSVSLPEISQTSRKNNISQEDSSGKIDRTSSADFTSKGQDILNKKMHPLESYSEEEVENVIEKISTEDDILTGGSSMTESEKLEKEERNHSKNKKPKDKEIKLKNYIDSHELSSIEDKICFSSTNLSISDSEKVKEIKPCFRKRKIIIKRTGNRNPIQPQLSLDSLCSSKNSNVSEHFLGSQIKLVKESIESYPQSTLSKQDDSLEGSFHAIDSTLFNKSQMYFLTDVLKKPSWNISITYLDLNKKTSSQDKSDVVSQKKVKFSPREEKIWKSDVLKLVETCFMLKYPQFFGTSNKTEKTIEYLHLLKKNGSFSEKEDTLTLVSNDVNNVRSSDYNTSTDFYDDVSVKSGNDTQNFGLESEISDSFASLHNPNEETGKKVEENPSRILTPTKNSEEVINIDSQSSQADSVKNDTDVKTLGSIEVEKKLKFVTSEVMREEDSFCSQGSDEPISLYYSKAADLASPLLDMRRFIYPDHIHYSYKHVNKKGFDVNINGGFPLLVGEDPPRSTPLNIANKSESQEPEIKRRPMDLSFATTNAFADWQNNYSNDIETKQNQTTGSDISTKKESEPPEVDIMKNMKAKKMKYYKKHNDKKDSRGSNGYFKSKSKSKPNDVTFMYSAKDYVLIEKLLRMHMQFHKNDFLILKRKTNERAPVQISSTQLHSNKGRKNSIKNPAIFLQKNKTRNEKKKIDTQEERTKDMFARLASEAFLQNNNVFTSSGSKRNI